MRSAIAFIVCAPLITWLVTALVAHPTLVGLVPVPIARAGAIVFIVALLWLAVRALIDRVRLDRAYAAGLSFGVASVFASALGFDPLPGVVGGILFCAIAVAGNRVRVLAQLGGWSAFVTAWLWTGIVLCVVALLAMLLRRPALLFSFAHGRAIGIFENPNELALFALALCAVAAGAWLAGPRLYGQRALAVAAFAAGAVTLLATGSRSGEASFGVGAVALSAMLVRRRGALVAIAVAAAIAVAVALSLDTRHNPAENESRLAAWHAGLRTAALFPLTGVGLGNFERIYPAVRTPDSPGPGDPIAFDPHDFYLTVAAETGLVGLGAFLWTIVCFVREARLTATAATPEARRFILTVLAGLLAVAVHLLFNAFALVIVLWSILAALILGLRRTVEAAAKY